MTPTEIVEQFIDAWNRMDWDLVMDLLTDDVVYHNIPMEKLEEKRPLRLSFAGCRQMQSIGSRST